MLTKIKSYLELGRAPGALATAMLPVVGANTSVNTPILPEILALIAVGIAAHLSIGTLNEIMDRNVDAGVGKLSHKPLVSKRVSLNNAWCFSITTFVITIIVTMVVFNNKFSSILFFIIAYCFAALYDVSGKYIAYAYDFTLSLGCAFLVIFGASCIGSVTVHTILAAALVFLAISSVQWYAGMKDVENDRKFSIPTTAVRWGYKYSKKLTLADANIRYIVLLKFIALVILLLFPLLGTTTSVFYIALVLLLVVPSQAFLMRKTLGKQNREKFLKLSMYDIASSWLAISITLTEKLDTYIVIVFLLPIIWTLFVDYFLYGNATLPKL